MKTLFIPRLEHTGRTIAAVSQSDIEDEVNLRQAPLLEAFQYGGEVTRAALNKLELHGDRKHVVVDTKVTFLLPGMYPAIPGWHTDGVPRLTSMPGTFDPAGRGAPSIEAQVQGRISEPHYHLLLAGGGPHTHFLDSSVVLDLPDADPSLYEVMTREVEHLVGRGDVGTRAAPEREWVNWSWWDIHAAQPATTAGWRYLIRVTESDHIAPRTDPKDFVRKQAQVYVPVEFGW